MGQYTEFYFRAKLAFTTPDAVKTLLQHKFDQTGWVDGSYAWLVNDNDPSCDPVEAPTGISWRGVGELSEQHPFFFLPRAFSIPYSNNWSNKDYPHRFMQHPDGGCTIEFGCEFKNYDLEIQQFLDWITPFVRFRFGKRTKGANVFG